MTNLPATTTGTTNLGDYGASILRTAVPSLWGTLVASLLTWLLPRVPGDVGDSLTALLQSEVAVAFLVTLSIAVWYAIARKVEPHVPDWLTRLILGSAAAPAYAKTTDDGAAIVTALPAPDDGPKHAA